MSDRNGRRPPRDEESQSDLPPEEELADTIEELDKACARTRQLIYRLRPLLRPEREEGEGEDAEERPRRSRPPVQFSRRRQTRR